jgi:hypothetical protein
MVHFYDTINFSFGHYLRRLHTRIPNRIIPLIYNDPVMQKLASIIGSNVWRKNRIELHVSGQEEQEHSFHVRADGNGTLVHQNYKNPYSYWPLFNQVDTPTNKVIKKKLYSHIMVF